MENYNQPSEKKGKYFYPNTVDKDALLYQNQTFTWTNAIRRDKQGTFLFYPKFLGLDSAKLGSLKVAIDPTNDSN